MDIISKKASSSTLELDHPFPSLALSFNNNKRRRWVCSGFGAGVLASLLLLFTLLFFGLSPSSSSSSSSSSPFSWFPSIPISPSASHNLFLRNHDNSTSTRNTSDLGMTHFFNNLILDPNATNSTTTQGLLINGDPLSEITPDGIWNSSSDLGNARFKSNSTLDLNNPSSFGPVLDPTTHDHDASSSSIVKGNRSKHHDDDDDHGNDGLARGFDPGALERSNTSHATNSSSSSSNAMEEFSDTSTRCDIFDGRWVRDEREPFYPAGSCPCIDNDFDCHKNGRPDTDFLRWRWQPIHCNIPRLNATNFLERLRGKRLLFVGDSLNRNMWESLVCILRHSIKRKARVSEASGRHEFKTKGYYSFRFEDYSCYVDFVRSPFLVRELNFKNANGSDDERLRLDLLDETTSAYREADIIVFNTGHWWTHEKTSKGIHYYQEGDQVYPVLEVMEAYKKALTTWASWVDQNINSSKTEVVFRGYSLTHFRGGQWNSGGKCHKETEPIFNETFLSKYPSKMGALESVMEQMKTPVIYLNVSRLTDYRKDGHPSIYRKTYATVEEQMAAELSQDCSHWCLPGIPDTWNELLYASLLLYGKSGF